VGVGVGVGVGAWAWYFGTELPTTYRVPHTGYHVPRRGVGRVWDVPGGRVARWIVGDGS